MFGMLIYHLDRLYHAVRSHAKATGEWQWFVLTRFVYDLCIWNEKMNPDGKLTSFITVMNSLKQDLIDLGKSSLQTGYKLTVTARMERYDCLLPGIKRQ